MNSVFVGKFDNCKISDSLSTSLDLFECDCKSDILRHFFESHYVNVEVLAKFNVIPCFELGGSPEIVGYNLTFKDLSLQGAYAYNESGKSAKYEFNEKELKALKEMVPECVMNKLRQNLDWVCMPNCNPDL